jgi:signal transduction histidine kinase
VFGLSPDPAAERTPLLDVVVPLSQSPEGPSFGVARYWVEGTSPASELRRIDEGLYAQAGAAFAGGAILVTLLLAWAYRQLASAQERLLRQSADLAQANEELDFAAKTGALGAISAHLIHGLKNPLAGLEGYVAETTSTNGEPLPGEARQMAMDTARRLRALVNDVTAVLRDEGNGGGDHKVPLREAVEAMESQAKAVAASAGVNVAVNATSDAELMARTASLAGLVVANLLTNAIQASPHGGTVRLEARKEGNQVEFSVSDAGTGLPPQVRAALFRPVRSTKAGGGGMGLAISQRLARHAGGELSLLRSDSRGTVFRLVVPAA